MAERKQKASGWGEREEGREGRKEEGRREGMKEKKSAPPV